MSSCFRELPSCDRVEDLADLNPASNDDIYGIGVLLAFVASGYLVFILLLAHYLIVFDPEAGCDAATTPRNDEAHDDRKGPITHEDKSGRMANSVDVRFLQSVRGLAKKAGQLLPSIPVRFQFDEFFSLTILSFCDTQDITGLGMLVSGFVSLRCGPPDSHISAYHWQMIVYLAWFATVAHLSGLTILRTSVIHRQAQRNFRLALTMLLFIMLFVAFWPTGWFNWDDNNCSAAAPGSPAICYLNPVTATHLHEVGCTGYADPPSSPNFPITRMDGPFETKAMQSMIVSLIILTLGLLVRIVKLFTPLSMTVYSCSIGPLSFIERMVLVQGAQYSALTVAALVRKPSLRKRSETLVWRLLFMPLAACFQTTRLFMDVMSSTLAEVWGLFILLLWGTLKFQGARYSGGETLEDESIWTFGQLFPVLLLLVPLFNAVCILVATASWHQPVSSQPVANPEKSQSANQRHESTTSDHSSTTLQPPSGKASTSNSSDEPVEVGLEDAALQNTVTHRLSKLYYYQETWIIETLLSLGLFICVVTGHFFYSTTDLVNVIPSIATKIARVNQVQFWITEQGALFYCLVSIPVATAWTILMGFHLGPWLSRNRNMTLRKLAMFLLAALIQLLYILATFYLANRSFVPYTRTLMHDGSEVNAPTVFTFFDDQVKRAQGKGFLLLTGLLYGLYTICCVVSLFT